VSRLGEFSPNKFAYVMGDYLLWAGFQKKQK
jgi:hypothetical protein